MNRESVLLAALAGVLLFVQGCAGTISHFQKNGLERAAFELECPKDQLAVTELSGNTFGVTGCGKKAVYMYSHAASAYVNNAYIQDEKDR